MKKLKILTSILLILVLCLSICPISHAGYSDRDMTTGPITITITNPEGNKTHKYVAYQIFYGTVAENKPEGEEETTTTTGKKTYTISNIFWGKDVRKPGETSDNIIEHSNIISDLGDNYKSYKNGEDVAAHLAEKIAIDDSEELIDFANVIKEYLTTDGTPLTPSETEEGVYTCEVPEAGYYLIMDINETTDVTENEAFSKYMLQVVGDVNITAKSDRPTLDKFVGNSKKADGIYESNLGDKQHNTAIIDEKEPILFKLVSKVPKMDGYKSYDFVITDTLEKGFDIDITTFTAKIVDYDPDVNPEDEPAKDSEVPATDIALTRGETVGEGDYYVEKAERNEDDETVLTITFNNILSKKALAGKRIVIEYKATLNTNASKGKVANKNKAFLTYSNDPHDLRSKGKTVEKSTETYTIDLTLTKVNLQYMGQPDQVEGGKRIGVLAGAEFDLYKYNPDGKDGVKEGDTPIVHLGPTDENGLVSVDGLGFGKYALVETKAPDTYNDLKDPIVFEVNANYDNTTGITWSTPDWRTDAAVRKALTGFAIINLNGDQDTLALEVGNVKGIILPSTGGIGTVIFTVVGLGIMAGSATLAFGTNKKKRK